MSHIPSQGPYVDTLIIDCSRSTSEEVKGDPTNDQNAVFTNKLGNGIKLNPGDKISVSSAYISERGVGGSVIEFKGETSSNQTYTLFESVISKPQLPNKFPVNGAVSSFSNLATPRTTEATPFADFGPLGAKKVVHTRTARTFTIQDNEANLETSFYKTTNGEGYIHLPRRYDIKPKAGQPQVVGQPTKPMELRQPNLENPNMLGQGSQSALNRGDSVNYDCPYNGRAVISPRITKCCPADWYIYQGLDDCGTFIGSPLVTPITPGILMMRSTCPINVPRAGGLWDMSDLIAQFLYRQVCHDGHALQSYQMKQKNDNSRYTIYSKDVCYYSEYVGDQCGDMSHGAPATSVSLPKPTYEIPDSFAEVNDTPNDIHSPYYSRDDFRGTQFPEGFDVPYDKEPAMTGYTKYTEIKKLQVPKGFNSPSNVAETLTNQLNSTKEQRTIYGVAGTTLGPYEGVGNQLAKAPHDTAAVQGAFDPRLYNQNSNRDGFNTGGTDAINPPNPYGSTLATGQRQIAVSTILESETLKSFACGNFDTWSEQNFIGYRGSDPRDVGANGVPAIGTKEWKTTPDRGAVLQVPVNPGVDNMLTSTFTAVHGSTTEFTEDKPNTVKNVQYMSNYQYIGVKRPELFDAFRDFWTEGLSSWRNFTAPQCLTGIPSHQFANGVPFITTVEWTDSNLKRFNAVFEAQGLYPEIFEGYEYSNIQEEGSRFKRPMVVTGVSSEYMRFIHLNSFSGTSPTQKGVQIPGDGTITQSEVPVYSHRQADATLTSWMPLGNDNMNTPLTDQFHTVAGVSTWANEEYDQNGVTTQIPMNQSRNAQDMSSSPLFIHYRAHDKDNDGGRNIGNQREDLAYGTMFRYTLIDPALGRTPWYTRLDGGVEHLPLPLTATLWDHHANHNGPKSFIGFNVADIGGIPQHLSDPWADVQSEDTLLAGYLVIGNHYEIAHAGTTVWTTMGAANNVPGTQFIATAAGDAATDGFAFSLTGGIPRPNNWLNARDDIVVPSPFGKGMGCGFDIHFNAYGTACIGLYSGYLYGDKYAVDTLKGGADIPGTESGSVDVKGEYYMDRGSSDPTVILAKEETTVITSGTATDRSSLIFTVTSFGGDIQPGYHITGPGIQSPCVVLSSPAPDPANKQFSVSPPQSLSNGVTLKAHSVVQPVTYQNQNISKYIRERYVGANQPLLNFDDKGERFNFQQLHSPLYIGNEANAGDGYTSVALEEGKQVLEINRRLMGNDFTPEMMPYEMPINRTNNKPEATDTTPPIQPMNSNIIPWQVYDSDGGIFLENFGLTANQWDLSLWAVLGFSYEQFHPTGAGNRQTRINNIIETTNLLVPTTNANLEASDVVKFRGNRYGSSLYTFQPPIASCLGPLAAAKEQTNVDYPVIVIDQTSAQINAQSLPRKMLKPFFLVKSNVIGDMSYWGGGDSGQNLPVVCVVNKENGFGDFYFQRGFDMEFTVTHPRMLTSVTTSIHDPDMKLSNVGPDSSLIFKITKMNHANLDVVQDVLQQQQQAMLKHKDKLKFMAEEEARAQARVRSQSPVTQRIGATEGLGDFVEPPGLSEMEQLGGNLATEHYGGESLASVERIQSRNIGRDPARAVQQLSARPVDTNVLVSGPQGEQLQTTPILANISPAGGGMGNMPANMPQGLGPWRLTGTSEEERQKRNAERDKKQKVKASRLQQARRTTRILEPGSRRVDTRFIGEGPVRRISQLSAEPVSTRVPVREEGSRANQNEAGRQPVGTLEERLQRARDAPR